MDFECNVAFTPNGGEHLAGIPTVHFHLCCVEFCDFDAIDPCCEMWQSSYGTYTEVIPPVQVPMTQKLIGG
jgi:hypothetical protein